MAEAVQSGSSESREPRFRIRTEVTKNTKGYQHETTVEVEWHGALNIGAELIARGLREADDICRREIAARMRSDGLEAANGST